MARMYRYFSADSHFESLPETWAHRVPAQYRERAPRRIKLADGRDAIIEEGQPLEYRGTNLFAGKSPEHFNPVELQFETAVGAGSPQQLGHFDRLGFIPIAEVFANDSIQFGILSFGNRPE